ncbi:hypothetical protein [Marinobacterium lacunae]|nr:hypothetical protein [Marinobacterium lacunae]MBR9882169.1 hypothetical protein [Oceanospirillales bacterium]
MSDTPVPRDFFARTPEERAIFMHETWCDNCQQVNLGMIEPFEYELHGIVFIEGRCCRCGEAVLTELTEDDF